MPKQFTANRFPRIGKLVCGIAFLVAAQSAVADEVAPDCCGPKFVLRGELTHSSYGPDRVANATSPDMYRDEVYGKDFTAFIEQLPEGDYTLKIYLAEMWAREPGKRVMDISLGNEVVAEDLDIFAEVGRDKEYLVSKNFSHQDESINGPLAVSFRAKSDNAKFNAFVIENSHGEGVVRVYAKDLHNADDDWASPIPEVEGPALYRDTSLPFKARIDDLIRRMSLREKAGQLMNNAPAIERLGIPAYEYWNECLHGVARAGNATVFPQAIGLAAMWDEGMMQSIADTIATEARAKNNGARAKDPNTRRYYGLTFWTPNINIFRDPRWGRGQETYGEDPYLTGRLGVAFIRGLQGDDPKYVKAMACAKHFAVHSGPEKLRHQFDAVAPERDLYDTYLPQFEAAVTEGHVGIVMSVYNAVDGIPGPCNSFLLTKILRENWGFAGHVVSDCDAVGDIWKNHKYVNTAAEASALAIKAGNDLNCGGTFRTLTTALKEGLLSEADIDVALKRVLMARFQLGLFDSPEQCEYLSIPASKNDTQENGAVALEAARKSLVLLKNDGVLPLERAKIKTLAVIGPNAESVDVLVANYAGDPSHPVTVLRGLRAEAGAEIKVLHGPGCPLAIKPGESYDLDSKQAVEALSFARQADVIVFVGGLNAQLEGEQMSTNFVGFDSGDRVTIELPEPQSKLLKALHDTGRPVIFVNLSGSAIAMPWEADHLPAILQGWYPGQDGGTAIADVLFGRVNPAGRLPVTFYSATKDLPDFLDYSIANRTYRYFKGDPLFAFGHGLSYTTFAYDDHELSSKSGAPDDSIEVKVSVANVGEVDGDEVVQVYATAVNPPVSMPLRQLIGFQRVHLKAKEKKTVEIAIPVKRLRRWSEEENRYVVDPGEYQIAVGPSSDRPLIQETFRVVAD